MWFHSICILLNRIDNSFYLRVIPPNPLSSEHVQPSLLVDSTGLMVIIWLFSPLRLYWLRRRAYSICLTYYVFFLRAISSRIFYPTDSLSFACYSCRFCSISFMSLLPAGVSIFISSWSGNVEHLLSGDWRFPRYRVLPASGDTLRYPWTKLIIFLPLGTGLWLGWP